MLCRFGNGLNLAGMLCQHFRPIITTLVRFSGLNVVARLKYAISRFKRHGRVPLRPMPRREEVAATIIVRGGIWGLVVMTANREIGKLGDIKLFLTHQPSA